MRIPHSGINCDTARGAFPVCLAFSIIVEAAWLFEACSARKSANNVGETS